MPTTPYESVTLEDASDDALSAAIADAHWTGRANLCIDGEFQWFSAGELWDERDRRDGFVMDGVAVTDERGEQLLEALAQDIAKNFPNVYGARLIDSLKPDMVARVVAIRQADESAS